MDPRFDIALIGLGVMGENLALNLAGKGLAVTGFDLDADKRARFDDRTSGQRAGSAPTLAQTVASLARPRKLLLMVPAGPAVDAVLDDLRGLLAPGDIVIDGGNSLFTDTGRRCAALRDSGILFVGMGVSGGEEGALRGPALMPGGDAEAWPAIRPLLDAIAARAPDGAPCCAWVGPGGAGHFVKMVHNGIEYADMQLLCEAYALLQRAGLDAPAMAEVFTRWNQGPLASYLVELTAGILRTRDAQSGQPLVDLVLDTAEQKGTGRWTSQVALDLGVPAPTIAEAVFSRALSAAQPLRQQAAAILAGPAAPALPAGEAWLVQVEQALLLGKLCAYAQGFALLRAADAAHGWSLPLDAIAATWRAGCIIRARVLEDIRAAWARDASLEQLLLDPGFAAQADAAQPGLRAVVATAAQAGVPVPGLSSALAWYDGLRSARLPANLLQAQRDAFGAHGYQRTDRPGRFHSHWG